MERNPVSCRCSTCSWTMSAALCSAMVRSQFRMAADESRERKMPATNTVGTTAGCRKMSRNGPAILRKQMGARVRRLLKTIWHQPAQPMPQNARFSIQGRNQIKPRSSFCAPPPRTKRGTYFPRSSRGCWPSGKCPKTDGAPGGLVETQSILGRPVLPGPPSGAAR
jgi:hypothetical protein